MTPKFTNIFDKPLSEQVELICLGLEQMTSLDDLVIQQYCLGFYDLIISSLSLPLAFLARQKKQEQTGRNEAELHMHSEILISFMIDH